MKTTESTPISIAVLIACHNRKQKTLECLYSIHTQTQLDNKTNVHQAFKFDLKYYLVDDGSTDGTADAVREQYPAVNIIQGSGSLFWNRAMHIAFSTATRKGHDAYLWMNDDTVLYPDALNNLLESWMNLQKINNDALIIVGSTRDPDTGRTTYGGFKQVSKLNPLKLKLLDPSETPIPCDTMNGNCVLISKSASTSLMNLDYTFEHGMGDIDYGLRAKKLGINIFVTPDYVGECSRNNLKGSHLDRALPLSIRIKKILAPTGLPIRSWLTLTRRHGGSFWPVHFVRPYIKTLLNLYTKPNQGS